MKKILTASLVAMMAVSAANADIASTNYVEDRTGEFTEQGGQLIGDYAGDGQELKNIANTDTLTKAIGKLDAAIDSVAGGELELGQDSVDTEQIVDGAVTNDKLAEGAAVANIGYTPEDEARKMIGIGEEETAEKLTDDQWKSDELYPSMNTATKMIDYKIATNNDDITSEISNVSNAKVSIDQTAQNANKAMITDAQGSVVAGQIATGMIADVAVTEAKLATDSVTTAKIKNGTVVEDDLHADVKASLALADSAIQVADFTDDSVALVTTGLQNTVSYMTEGCNEANAVCSLVSRGGKLVWEKVSY